jgi:hypothetical protein
MTNNETACHLAIDPDLRERLNRLVREEVDRTLPVATIAKLLEGGFAGISSLANMEKVTDGRLLEKAIVTIAESNPNLVVVTQLKLPVREDALELVDKNSEALLRGLSFDANARTRRSYAPDLTLIDRSSHVAYLVDIKRSLGSYEAVRITELRQRMLAAALVLPDVLWRERKRTPVEEVRVVILEAAGKRTDPRAGIWNLTHLDQLLGVTGAAALVQQVHREFALRAAQNLAEALQLLPQKSRSASTSGENKRTCGYSPEGSSAIEEAEEGSPQKTRRAQTNGSDDRKELIRFRIVPPPNLVH